PRPRIVRGLRSVAGDALLPCSPALRIVGPVAVDADNTPLHAEPASDHAAVLHDRVAHRPPQAIGGLRLAAAEPARNGAVGPGPIGILVNLVEVRNRQIGIPETAFL